MALAAVAGLAAIGALLKDNAPKEGYYDYVASQFASAHSTYPKEVWPDNKIDGSGYPYNQKQLGFPSMKNSLRNFWTYPNYEASKLINKDKKNWKVVYRKVLDKEKQLDQMEIKLNCDDHILLTPQYKQINTKTTYPKINYKPGIIQNL